MVAAKLSPGPLLEFTRQGVRQLARRLGVDAAVLCRPLTIWQADRFAVRCGVHPQVVWGLAFHAGGEEPDDDLSAEELREAAQLAYTFGMAELDHERSQDWFELSMRLEIDADSLEVAAPVAT